MALRLGIGLGIIPQAARPAPTTAPVNTVLPSITGILTQGQTLTADPGSWTGLPSGAFTYQWKRSGSNISGATNSTYVAQADDVSAGASALTVTVTATNDIGSTPATSSGVTIAAPLTISGTPGSATVGAAYTFTPTSAGGHTPKTYALTGTLPAGLSFNTSTGAITGTPTTSGTASGLDVTVTDADGLTASLGAFSIVVSVSGSSVPADLTGAMRGGFFMPNITRADDKVLVGHCNLDRKTYVTVFDADTGAQVNQRLMFTASRADDHTPTTVFPMANGKVLCIGCPHNDGLSHYFSVYDPATNTFSSLSSFTSGSNVSYALPVQDASGRIWVFYRYNNSEWHFRVTADNGATFSSNKRFVLGSGQMYMRVAYLPSIDSALLLAYDQPEDGSGRIHAACMDFTTAAYDGGTSTWTATVETASDDTYTAMGTFTYETQFTNWRAIYQQPAYPTDTYGARPFDLRSDGKALLVAHFTKANIARSGVTYLHESNGSLMPNEPAFYNRFNWTTTEISDAGGSFGWPAALNESYYAECRFNAGPTSAAYSLLNSTLPPGSGSYSNGRLELLEGSSPSALSHSLIATSSIAICRPAAPAGGDTRLRYSWLEHEGFISDVSYEMINPVIKFSNTATPYTLSITSSDVVFNVEGATLAHSLTASYTVTWSLTESITRDGFGADNGKVEIVSGSTLRFLSNATKDFDAPDNAQADNIYRVRLCGTTSSGAKVYQNLSVVVTTDPTGTAWLPSSDAAIKAWWDAADLADGAVTTWADKIAGIAPTQATSGNRPTKSSTSFNGAYAGVTFDGTNDVLSTTSFTALQGLTQDNVFIVMAPVADGSATSRRAFTYGGTSGATRRTIGASGTTLNAAEFDAGGALIDKDYGTLNGPTMLLGRVNGTTQYGQRDTRPFSPSASASRTASASGTSRLAIGATNGGTPAAYSSGVIHAIVVGDGLTESARQRLFGYFAHATGLTSLLPANHPFKINAPRV